MNSKAGNSQGFRRSFSSRVFHDWFVLATLLLVLQVIIVGFTKPEQVFVESYAIPYSSGDRVRISNPFQLSADQSQGVRIAVTSASDLSMLLTLINDETGEEQDFPLQVGAMDGVPTNGAWRNRELTLAGVAPGAYRLQMRVATGGSSSGEAFEVKVFQRVVLWRYWAWAMFLISIVPFAVWWKERAMATVPAVRSPLQSV